MTFSTKYKVKRKNTQDCGDIGTCGIYGRQDLDNCQKTCTILNAGKDNIRKTKTKTSNRFFLHKSKQYFYFPSLVHVNPLYR